MGQSDMWIGIDFGTCSSSAAVLTEEKPQMIRDSLNQHYSFPSCVYICEDGNIIVGHAANNERTEDPSRFRSEFKRDLGQVTPYPFGRDCEYEFLPEELISIVLKEIKKQAELVIADVTSAIITVPATYLEYKKQLMLTAAREAGFNQVKLLEEPVAAAIYYAQYEYMNDDEVFIVYDLGGGTFDAALVRKEGSKFKFLSEAFGIPRCGGIDFDLKIFENIKNRSGQSVREFLDPKNNDPKTTKIRWDMLDICRDIKHKLSISNKISKTIQLDLSDYELKREDFEEMIFKYIDQTIDICLKLIKNAQSMSNQTINVNRVLLVGGSCRIPYVSKLIEQRLGVPTYLASEPELIVCQGAAIYSRNFFQPSSTGIDKNTEIEEASKIKDDSLTSSRKIEPSPFYDPNRGIWE